MENLTADTQLRSFTAFLTVYSVNLVHRFPDVSDLNSINQEDIRSIAQFCAVATNVAIDTWNELSQPQRRQSGIRSTRAAG